jgi:hypothetical protein
VCTDIFQWRYSKKKKRRSRRKRRIRWKKDNEERSSGNLLLNYERRFYLYAKWSSKLNSVLWRKENAIWMKISFEEW